MIWPFVALQEAKSLSKNRHAGTLEMKTVTATREVYTSYLKEKLFPSIRSKFPIQRYTPVSVQQDNNRSHISPENIHIIAAGLPVYLIVHHQQFE